MDTVGSRPFQNPGHLIDGRPGRHNIVHQQNIFSCHTFRRHHLKSPTDIFCPLGATLFSLGRSLTNPRNRPHQNGKVQYLRHRLGQDKGLIKTSFLEFVEMQRHRDHMKTFIRLSIILKMTF